MTDVNIVDILGVLEELEGLYIVQILIYIQSGNK